MTSSILDWWALRRFPKPLPHPHTVIYDWRPYRGFHILNVFAGALRIGAIPGESAPQVLERVPRCADTFLFNLDLSSTAQLPQQREQLVAGLAARGVDVWNADVTDTSKRRIQAVCAAAGLPGTLAAKDGDPTELVIVKSNSNYAAWGERKLNRAQREVLGIEPPPTLFRTKYDYRVLQRRDVSEWMWTDESLQVERFISHPEGLWYRVRFLFDHWIVSEVNCGAPVKTMENSSKSRDVCFQLGESVDVPSDLIDTCTRFLSAFGIDYGALDVLPDVNGQYFVIDVNATPGMTFLVEGQLEALRRAWADRRTKKGRQVSLTASNVV